MTTKSAGAPRHGRIGFLKAQNRINVMLSRAQHGMVILGHVPSLVLDKDAKMWPQVLVKLEKEGCVGPGLPIKCHLHSDETKYITSAQDFQAKAPEGGCTRMCSTRLPCGHQCPR